MVDQLLWINALICLVFGATLVVAPKPLIALIGLPRAEQTFYPRLLGALLFGMGLAVIVEGADRQSSGLGLGGLAAINLTVAAVILVLIMFGRLALPMRGRLGLKLFAAMLVLLAGLQYLYA